MAQRSPTICNRPGCSALVVGRYCPEHRKAWDRPERPGSTTERGYGWRWQKLRLAILRRDKELCQPCLREDRLTKATEVDHIKPKADGGTDRHSNLQAICTECHRAKSSQEGNSPRGSKMGTGGKPAPFIY